MTLQIKAQLTALPFQRFLIQMNDGRSIELQAIVDQLLPCPHHGGEILFGSWPPYQWIQEHGWR